ncbi:hypothetical protein [Euzebya sp.]|uniref:hypothetical protein n=1 Tax=Euzebya sp. TaxID=1971409 RepID=UPI0035199A25
MTGGVAAASLAFGVAAMVIVALMFIAAFTVSRAQRATVERIQANAPAVKKWGGVLLLMVGAWFVSLALFADIFAQVFTV